MIGRLRYLYGKCIQHLPFTSIFAQVPNELWDAARMDGCDHLRFLIQIVLPISKAAVLTVLLFGFTASWNAFNGRFW